jgi:hypothetical protein
MKSLHLKWRPPIGTEVLAVSTWLAAVALMLGGASVLAVPLAALGYGLWTQRPSAWWIGLVLSFLVALGAGLAVVAGTPASVAPLVVFAVCLASAVLLIGSPVRAARDARSFHFPAWLWWLGIVGLPPFLALGLALVAGNPLSDAWGAAGLYMAFVSGSGSLLLLSPAGRRACGVSTNFFLAAFVFAIAFVVGGVWLTVSASLMWCLANADRCAI